MTLRRAILIACLMLMPGILAHFVPRHERSASEVVARVVGAAAAQPSAVALAGGFALELVLHAAWLVLLLRSAWFAALWPALPVSLRAIGAAMLTLLMAGFLSGHAVTFPFVAWHMYAGEDIDKVSVYTLSATSQAGVSRVIDMESILPALSARHVHLVVESQAQWVDAATDAERRFREEVQRRTLAGLGRLWAAGGAPADPLRQVSLHVRQVAVDAVNPPWLSEPRLLAQVDIGQ